MLGRGRRRKLVGLEIVQVTCDKIKVIRDKLKIAQDRQKSYANNRRRDLKFEVWDMVFLRISPWKGVLRFGKRGKLSPWYIGPYRIVERIGEVAYRLELPSDLDRIHDVFNVSMLRKYIPDPSHVLIEQPVDPRPSRASSAQQDYSAGEGILEESYSRGSYLGAKGSDAPSLPSIIFRMRYFPFVYFGV